MKHSMVILKNILKRFVFVFLLLAAGLNIVVISSNSLVWAKGHSSYDDDDEECEECERGGYEGTNFWDALIGIAPVVGLGAIGYFNAQATQGVNKAWASAYKYSSNNCKDMWQMYLTSRDNRGANPVASEDASSFMGQCSTLNGLGLAGFGGMYANGLGIGAFGNPYLGGGFSTGMLGGMMGPYGYGGYGMGGGLGINIGLGGSFGMPGLGGGLYGGGLYGGGLGGGLGFGIGGGLGMGAGMGMGMGIPGMGMGMGMGMGVGSYPYGPGMMNGVMQGSAGLAMGPWNNGVGSYWNATGGWNNNPYMQQQQQMAASYQANMQQNYDIYNRNQGNMQSAMLANQALMQNYYNASSNLYNNGWSAYPSMMYGGGMYGGGGIYGGGSIYGGIPYGFSGVQAGLTGGINFNLSGGFGF